MTAGQKRDLAGKEPDGRKWRKRLIGLVGAVVATTLAWAAIEGPGGVDLIAPTFDGSPSTQDIGLGAVALTTVVVSLAALVLLLLVERFAPRPRRTWTALAVVALVVSLGGPLAGGGVENDVRGMLALLHLVVAAVLIPSFSATAPISARRSK